MLVTKSQLQRTSPTTTAKGIPFHDGCKKGTYFGKVSNCRQSLRHGSGKMVYNDGTSFDGLWKDNQKHGDGVFYHRTGIEVHGCFDHNLITGVAVCYLPWADEKSNPSLDGKKCRGEWRSIALVKYHRGNLVGKGILFDFFYSDYTELISGVSQEIISSGQAFDIIKSDEWLGEKAILIAQEMDLPNLPKVSKKDADRNCDGHTNGDGGKSESLHPRGGHTNGDSRCCHGSCSGCGGCSFDGGGCDGEAVIILLPLILVACLVYGVVKLVHTSKKVSSEKSGDPNHPPQPFQF
jgi:hypothetical protein